jgi:3' exoribonuclease, RNase T-like
MDTPYDIYFSADIETDGPIPGPYSMLSFGIAVAGAFDGEQFLRADPSARTFYRELKPISDTYDAETAAVSGLDRQRLLIEGTDPSMAMDHAADWIHDCANGGSPVLIAFPLSFDWSWLWWYFNAFSERGSPFGFSNCYDIKTAYAVRAGRPITLSGRSKLPDRLRSSRPHEHHALADAIEQADIFANLMEWDDPE